MKANEFIKESQDYAKLTRAQIQGGLTQYWQKQGYVNRIIPLASKFDRVGQDGIYVYEIVTLDEDSGMYIVNEVDINPERDRVEYVSPTPTAEYESLEDAKKALGITTRDTSASLGQPGNNLNRLRSQQARLDAHQFGSSIGGDASNYRKI